MIRKAVWALMALLATLVAVYAFMSVSVPSLRSPFVSNLFAEKALRTLTHLGAGGIALVAGAFQFTRLRFSAPRVQNLIVAEWPVVPSSLLAVEPPAAVVVTAISTRRW